LGVYGSGGAVNKTGEWIDHFEVSAFSSEPQGQIYYLTAIIQTHTHEAPQWQRLCRASA
jgi:hypothetical protein